MTSRNSNTYFMATK